MAVVSHYTIISKIGAGGMGEVYQDEDCRARFKRKAIVFEAAPEQDRCYLTERTGTHPYHFVNCQDHYTTDQDHPHLCRETKVAV